jgi:peptidoglycan/LPS O-acetylase OafA/YrhL
MLPNITSLRFFLALLVVIFHLAEFSKKHQFAYYDGLAVFHKGLEAVYVFFSLSGFLIIRQLYIEKMSAKTISLVDFFSRRMARIFPLYIVIFSFGLLYYHIILPKMGYPFENNYDLIDAIVLCLFFMPNIFAGLYHPGGIISVLWSIGIEEQFYLFIAPLLLLLPVKRVMPFLLMFTVIYFVVFFVDSFYLLRQFQMYFFYFSSAGISAILLVKHPGYFNNKIIRNSLLLIFIAYFTTTFFQDYLSVPMYQLLSLLLFSLTIVYLAANPISILNSRPLIYLGKISYGIYMFHTIVIQLLAYLFIKTGFRHCFPDPIFILLYNFLAILLTVLISHLSYKYFESYFIKNKKMPK